MYNNYSNSQINIARLKSLNTIIGSNIWDIVDKVLNSLKKRLISLQIDIFVEILILRFILKKWKLANKQKKKSSYTKKQKIGVHTNLSSYIANIPSKIKHKIKELKS